MADLWLTVAVTDAGRRRWTEFSGPERRGSTPQQPAEDDVRLDRLQSGVPLRERAPGGRHLQEHHAGGLRQGVPFTLSRHAAAQAGQSVPAFCLRLVPEDFRGGQRRRGDLEGVQTSLQARSSGARSSRLIRLGHHATGSVITLNRLSMSGNLAYLRQVPEGTVSTQIVRIYIEQGDEEFFTIIRRYEDIFTVILTEWSGVDTIQCQLKMDRMDEWFLQLMVTRSRWPLERLKDIVVYPSFREVLTLVFKRQISQF
ncbi:uncharacterized protein LOC142768358 [Rhipicephalus microplus]|uniref:uncharacterized protein LOC142768358 n=1 Tax=Rhipicephalus microplus TaxID=6941 RepID=UPI003F6B238C